ncbi:unnamed protein product [Effrenium voratum]|nr:unnamed protein product [Effrenium voratum]
MIPERSRSVAELRSIQRTDSGLTVGAACTLTTLIEARELETASKERQQLLPVVEHLKLVAHPQVRDVASWAGNVMIAKTHPDFPSDVCLLLSTLKAKLTLIDSAQKTEQVDVIDFLSSKLPRNDPAQIIHSVTIPFPGAETFLDTFKVMRRHMNTHAEVNAGFLFEFSGKDGVKVANARLVVGNIEHQPFVASETAKALLGKDLDSVTIDAAKKTLQAELKAHLAQPTVPEPPFVVVDPQHFTVDSSTAPLGQPLTKVQGLDQACGTAQFVADAPLLPKTLFALPVLVQKLATLQRIDASECLQVEGVHSFLSAADVKAVGASNAMNLAYHGKIFADAAEKPEHLGQFLGLVLADSFEAARTGVRLVHVEYGEEVEATVSTADGVLKGSVQERHGVLSIGTHTPGTKSLQGKISSAGQKHFYLEPQTTYAYTDCNGGLIVNSSCQVLDLAQTQLAKTLHMPMSKINVQNQRLGGAYGGKAMLFAPGCLAVCIAVLKTKRPVLLQMDRTADFQAFGARAPFDASWDCSIQDDGKICSLKQEILQNVGTDMMGFSQASSVNCYNLPHAQLHCKGVITNLPCNTWMRAPGDFEGAFIMEAIMEQVARAVGREPVEVQELNLDEAMQKAWQRLKTKVSYDETLKSLKDFNSKSYRKKGIYCLLTNTWGGPETSSREMVSAILEACGKLQKEMQPWVAAGRGWQEVVMLATKAGAELTQAGVTEKAKVHDYMLFSAGCAQVEIDVLTGETQVNSFDLVYDCGKSLNPAVDIGQIEGSLMQALGFSLLEEETRGKDGRLINCGTWDYKIPSGNDIPVRLDVELLPCLKPDAPVMGSKASGEPAQLLGGAFFYAVKDAIGYAREELGLSRVFRMDPPASPSRIQTFCEQ